MRCDHKNTVRTIEGKKVCLDCKKKAVRSARIRESRDGTGSSLLHIVVGLLFILFGFVSNPINIPLLVVGFYLAPLGGIAYVYYNRPLEYVEVWK